MTEPYGSSPQRRGASQRVVAALVVALALVTGLIGGVAIDRGLLLHRGGHGPWTMHGTRGRAPGGDRVRQRFATALGLTPTQMTEVDSIMSRRMSERRVLQDSMGARMRVLFDSTRGDIDRILTPEQRQKFAALRARHDSASARRGRGGGPPPDGRGGPPP